MMRTTITLDPDVARELEEQQHRVRKTFKEVVNEALRRGLASWKDEKKRTPYKLKPMAGVLLDKRAPSVILAELEVEDFLTKRERGSRPTKKAG
jgi:hypothetical protein